MLPRPVLAALAAAASFCHAQPPAAALPKAPVKAGARIAIVGDSITEQKLYSRFMASYLYAAHPQLDVRVVQFGWSGEAAPGFLARMANDLAPFKPDVVTLCYGMNDGRYAPFNADTGKAYGQALTKIVAQAKAGGAAVVVGSPGAVDDYFFGREGDAREVTKRSKMYNPTLGELRNLARKIAKESGQSFANVHDVMLVAMRKAQANGALGNEYPVCGYDGFHPAANGQLAMALAFLRALDISGDLGTVTIDFRGKPRAENGHDIVGGNAGTAEIASRRLPFAHAGDAKSPDGTRSILPYLPFNEEFNRFTLKVQHAPAEKLAVTWGAETKTFSKAELEKGVNLAAAFENHPLAEAFRRVDRAVAEQQNFQTMMIKQHITNHRNLARLAAQDRKLADALDLVRDRLWAEDARRHDAVKAVLKSLPVKHAIKVAPAP